MTLRLLIFVTGTFSATPFESLANTGDWKFDTEEYSVISTNWECYATYRLDPINQIMNFSHTIHKNQYLPVRLTYSVSNFITDDHQNFIICLWSQEVVSISMYHGLLSASIVFNCRPCIVLVYDTKCVIGILMAMKWR